MRTRLENWLFADKHALYGVAMCRILAGISIIGLLGTNFGSRSVLVGPASSWAGPSRDLSDFPILGLVAGHSDLYVTVFYLATMLFAALFALGWHTRVVGALALIGHVALIEQNPLIGDQGDNVLRIGMIWLLLVHSSEVWSLDARKQRGPVVPLWFTNGLHNIALCGLALQIVVIYIAAAAFKLQGALWRDGTALYYPLQLPAYRPFPWLSDLLVGNSLILAVATYAAVGIQLLFPPMLLNRITRRMALTFVILLHASIAVLMGLPWFSLSMVAYDAIFVSTATYVALDSWIRRSPMSPWRSFFVQRR
ncbi:MAG: HTTM domain-containing protein [Actinomycetota bacterium]|nr:HTTM domain-containing protein [Actinomycetota bacterium]